MSRTGVIRVVVLVAGLGGAAGLWGGEMVSSPGRDLREQVEADWMLQERVRKAEMPGEVTPAADAAGGCDGVKNGEYGFHTGLTENPWWQVDLGATTKLDRVVVWNRCDGAVERAWRLRLWLSADGEDWRVVYEHRGAPFLGGPDGKPLEISARGEEARFVRIRVPGKTYLHLDEVEVFAAKNPRVNVALHRPATQVSASQWSTASRLRGIDWTRRTGEIVARCRHLLRVRGAEGVDVTADRKALDQLESELRETPAARVDFELYRRVRWIQRKLVLSSQLLDFDSLLFVKRVPGSFNHMSDQYIGWWSRPGGGIHVLEGLRSASPHVRCISESFREPGSFLRPMLSHDGTHVLFAWCRHYPGLRAEQNKLDKNNVPEDAFYHVFEMRTDGTEVRQLTHGKYDDFDARYLPDGRIVFLSTRRGQFIQCGPDTARRTLAQRDLPDVYVRCGGGPERPCVVYTLHSMNADGGELRALSPFEMFEWTPSVTHDGTILYSRWDYVDRHNMPFMSLWAINPDGTNARAVYGNFTRAPHCIFEPRAVPGSSKIVFTASAHHSQTKGSLVLLDPGVTTEGPAALMRLTPEVAFPEIEGWPVSCYAHPWPLSESLYLCSWGAEGLQAPATSQGWDRWHSVDRPRNGMGLYVFEASGALELIYRDPFISCVTPIPLRARPRPHGIPDLTREAVESGEPSEGRFLLLDVYEGLETVQRGDIRALRIVAVPPKTHPTMNYPTLGITRDDPGKCVLGTVPVESDGSAHFRVPAGVIVFFQALDERGMAVQTMRSATHVQPGQTLSCIGCHERRQTAPPRVPVLAARREPSIITAGPAGSWPLRYDQLVQPVLDRNCVSCHRAGAEDPEAARFDLTSRRSYESLTGYGKPSLKEHVLERYHAGRSTEGACVASRSPLLRLLTGENPHHGLELSNEDLDRLITWMDTYAQRLGSFSDQQERQLLDLREAYEGLVVEGSGHRRTPGQLESPPR